MAFQPSGIVTLLTDFGARDAYVGIMKGVLHTHAPELRSVVDLTHEVEPQDVAFGAFQLAHAWRWFPEGSVHVAVVDPGVGSARRIVAGLEDGHVFVAPDNGLLGAVLSDAAVVREVDIERFGFAKRSRTFHGRDVFAPTAAALVHGTPFDELGPEAELRDPLRFPEPTAESDGTWRGEVLIVDRFGNLVSNLPDTALGGDATGWTVEIAGRSVPVHGTYAEVEPGELLALVDSFDRLEVACRNGDAARRLGCGPSAAFTLRRTR